MTETTEPLESLDYLSKTLWGGVTAPAEVAHNDSVNATHNKANRNFFSLYMQKPPYLDKWLNRLQLYYNLSEQSHFTKRQAKFQRCFI